MARRKMDILLVRKDAPVHRMRLGPWLIYFFVLLICLTVAGLAGGGYLLYRQNQALQELIKDNRRMSLVSRNLESMLRDLQDRVTLATKPQPAPPPPPPPPKAEPPAPKAAPPQPAPPPPPRPAPPVEEPKPVPPAEPRGSGPDRVKAPHQAEGLEPWPTSCDWVEIRKVTTQKKGRDLLVYFNVTNTRDDKKLAEGYVAVILRGERKGAPWLEAWPPTSLTPLGRPANPKRTAAFEVRRYRRLRARFTLVDKKVDTLEFIIYDQEGDLAMIMRHSLNKDQG